MEVVVDEAFIATLLAKVLPAQLMNLDTWRPILKASSARAPFPRSSKLTFSTGTIWLPNLASKGTFLGFPLPMKARFRYGKRSLSQGAVVVEGPGTVKNGTLPSSGRRRKTCE